MVQGHYDRCERIMERYGFTNREEVSRAVMIYFDEILKVITGKMKETISLRGLGTFHPFDRDKKTEEIKKKAYAKRRRNDTEKKEHKKRVYLQRRVQAL